MSGSTEVSVSAEDVVALSVHGPAGVLDLQVPRAASGADVATEYSRQARLPTVPVLYTRLGRLIAPDSTVAAAGLGPGDIVVAVSAAAAPAPASARRRRADSRARPRLATSSLSALWFTVAASTAVIAGGLAARLPESSDLRSATIALLVAAAVLGALPLGPLASQRVLAAPAFAGAAAFAVSWDPTPEKLPTIIGISALAAGLAAAFARALDRHAEEGLRVWTVVGIGLFVVTTLAALADVPAQVVWALLLLAAMLAVRFVPLIAVDVPDQFLVDLERLAVSAWSARDRPTGRRGRTIVPRQAVVAVAASGARMVTAASAAVLVVATVSSALLLREATISVDPVGARLEVGLVGASLLLAARSYRHAGARSLLYAAGLGCWLVLVVQLFALTSPQVTTVLSVASITMGLVLVLVAVRLGRGWRSAWWARRAEVAESICGAFAFGAVVVASGLFHTLWELTG